MSHMIKYLSCLVEGFNQKQVEASIRENAARDAYPESGYVDPIRYIDKVFDSYDEAKEYIETNSTRSYNCMAVKYKSYDASKKWSKKVQEAYDRKEVAWKKYTELDGKFHFAEHSAQYISCPKCGSKIARSYLQRNYCPVCKADMRPLSTQSQIAKLKTKAAELYENFSKLLKEENENQKYKLMWLIRVEYHV